MATIKTSCNFCNEKYKQEDLYAVDRDQYICEACKDSEGVNYCEKCEEDFTENYLSVCEVLINSGNRDTAYWCTDCIDNGAEPCHDCVIYVSSDVSRYCEDCDVTLCGRCWENNGEHYHEDEDEDEDSNDLFDTRTPDTSIPDSVAGKLMPENLSCGFECEVINSDRVYMNDFIDSQFGIVGDGSLNNGGVEIVSPARKGKEFEAITKRLAKDLKRAGVKIDSSCGLHLHVGIPEQYRNDRILYRLYSMYNRIEPVIFAMLPDSRATGTYCKPLKDKELPVSIKNKLQKKGASFMPIWYGTEKRSIRYTIANCIELESNIDKPFDNTIPTTRLRFKEYESETNCDYVKYQDTSGKTVITTSRSYREQQVNNIYGNANYIYQTKHEGKPWVILSYEQEEIEQYEDWNEGFRQAESKAGEKYDQSRYHGCNLHSIFYRGTLELRYHSGTISAEKIINWAHIHAMIVNYCISDSFSFRDLARLDKAKNIKTKVSILRDLVGLNEGVYTYILDRIKYFHSDLLEPKKHIKPVATVTTTETEDPYPYTCTSDGYRNLTATDNMIRDIRARNENIINS